MKVALRQARPRQIRREPATGFVVQSLEELIMILCSESEGTCHVDDRYASLRHYCDFDNKELAHAAYLVEGTEFTRWIQNFDSDLILVDGHCGNAVKGRTSPMSVLCASLIQSLSDVSAQQQGTTGAVLYFFCGQHMNKHGPLPGPQGLIRSLTNQLIMAWHKLLRVYAAPPPNLRFLSNLLPGTVSSAQEDLDIDTVCNIFYALLEQLPAGFTVYCIVDGLSYFETSLGGWSDEIEQVVDCLQQCCDSYESELQVTVKVMLASAHRSIKVCEQIPSEQIVNLRAGKLSSAFASPRRLMETLQGQASFSGLVHDEQDEEEFAEEQSY